MMHLDIRLDAENAWPDLADKERAGKLILLDTLSIAALAEGMTSGATAVAFRFDLPDGSSVLAQTSLALFLNAALAFKTRYPGG